MSEHIIFRLFDFEKLFRIEFDCENMNNEHNTGQTIKPVRRLRVVSRRTKPTAVRDVAGSLSTFKRFYQSGGRDYEQYRLWLQTLVKSNSLTTPSNTPVQVDSIKEEYVKEKKNN